MSDAKHLSSTRWSTYQFNMDTNNGSTDSGLDTDQGSPANGDLNNQERSQVIATQKVYTPVPYKPGPKSKKVVVGAFKPGPKSKTKPKNSEQSPVKDVQEAKTPPSPVKKEQIAPSTPVKSESTASSTSSPVSNTSSPQRGRRGAGPKRFKPAVVTPKTESSSSGSDSDDNENDDRKSNALDDLIDGVKTATNLLSSINKQKRPSKSKATPSRATPAKATEPATCGNCARSFKREVGTEVKLCGNCKVKSVAKGLMCNQLVLICMSVSISRSTGTTRTICLKIYACREAARTASCASSLITKLHLNR